MRTTDGGVTWEEQFPGLSSWKKQLFFTDNNHGWIARDEGDILYTVDGGITWQHMYVNFNGTFGGIFFTNIDNGWVVGEDEAILHISNGSALELEEDGFRIPNSGLQVECFPNPTSGISHFSFFISQYQWVSMKIYDVHGREVAEVLDEKLPAGEHAVQFDVSGLPGGIYLVRMQAGVEAASTVIPLSVIR